MATSYAQDVTRGLNTVLAGNWLWLDVANGFRSGYGTVNSYENLSQRNLRIKDRPVVNQTFSDFVQSFIQSSWKITRTTIKAHRIAPAFPFLASRTTALKCTAVGWIGMNVLALLQHALMRKDDSLIEDTAFGAIWQNTPNALLVTNIALTALELRINFTKAAISFVSMGISYLDIKWDPKKRSSLWNWGLPIAARSVVLYYGNNWQRTMVGIDIATSTVKFLYDRK